MKVLYALRGGCGVAESAACTESYVAGAPSSAAHSSDSVRGSPPAVCGRLPLNLMFLSFLPDEKSTIVQPSMPERMWFRFPSWGGNSVLRSSSCSSIGSHYALSEAVSATSLSSTFFRPLINNVLPSVEISLSAVLIFDADNDNITMFFNCFEQNCPGMKNGSQLSSVCHFQLLCYFQAIVNQIGAV